MKITFSKYHGAGNDFIMIDGRTLSRTLAEGEISYLCHRYFGIGADGVIIIEPHESDDFTMNYHNADGSSGMMCSNGSRCAIHYARKIGYEFTKAKFSCCGAPYVGRIYNSELIGTSFPDLSNVKDLPYGHFVDNGAWHLVIFDQKNASIDHREVGRYWRYHEDFAPTGINVNFVEVIDDNALEIITYERGVENITLACGTGALASAMAFIQKENRVGPQKIAVKSGGGTLIVKFDKEGSSYASVEVAGPAIEVFTAEIVVQKLARS